MENPQYEQLQLFYTQEEVDAKLSEATQLSTLNKMRELALQNERISDAIFRVMKDEADNTMTKESAQELYDRFVNEAGLVARTIQSTYSVTVSVDDRVVGTFDGVEAEDADDACDIVTEAVEAEMRLEISYNGVTLTDTIYGWDLNITAEAEEE